MDLPQDNTTTVDHNAQQPADSPAIPTPPHPMASLYVGDLNQEVTETMLFDKFGAIGPVSSIRVCRDAITRRSLGYAYVNFQQPEHARQALKSMNFDVMMGKPIRIMWAQRDPSVRRSGSGNIFIKNLDTNIDTRSIYDTFSMFGSVLSCKVVCDPDGQSKGYGFIHFETEESALTAIEKVNGMLLEGKKVYVAKFLPRAARMKESGWGTRLFTNVYLKNFEDTLDDEKLVELFSPFGTITSAKVMVDEKGQSRGFGFVAFENPEEAAKAVNEMNDKEVPGLEGKKFTVCRAQKKSERQAELKRRFEKLKAERAERYRGANLYVKNLDDSVTSEKLRENFEEYGNITSAKVMCDENGRSKGFGFVCYDKAEDASKAVSEMNNKILADKKLYVALAQRKEERKAHLTSKYMQRLASMRQHQNSTGIPNTFYAPAQGGFYVSTPVQSQRTTAFMAPAASIPGAHVQVRDDNPRWATNFNQLQFGFGHGLYSLYGQGAIGQQQTQQYNVHQAQRGPRVVGPPGQPRLTGGQGPYNKFQRQPARFNNQQQQSRFVQGNSGKRAFSSQYQSVQSQQQYFSVTQCQDSLTQLLNEETKAQKQALGEKLYPLVARICKDEDVGKITGMMLEMDNENLVHLLEHEDMLQVKIFEAVEVLKRSKLPQ